MSEQSERKLRNTFHKAIEEMANELDMCAAGMGLCKLSPGQVEKGRSVSHRLHGAGELYGFSCVSELGQRFEEIFDKLERGVLPPSQETQQLAKSFAVLLRTIPNQPEEAVCSMAKKLIWDCDGLLYNGGNPSPK